MHEYFDHRNGVLVILCSLSLCLCAAFSSGCEPRVPLAASSPRAAGPAQRHASGKSSVSAALAADQPSAPALDPVYLDGSASHDRDSDKLSYRWTQVSGPVSELHGADTAKPWFRPPAPGTYTFELIVSDPFSASEPARVTVAVQRRNRPPVARAQQTLRAELGTVVLLDGRASFDPDGELPAFLWTQTGGPRVALKNARAAVARFQADQPDTYTFTLRVADRELQSQPLKVIVYVRPPNAPPVADAGGDQAVERTFGQPSARAGNTHPVLRVKPGGVHEVGEYVVLDASESYDVDGDELLVKWRQEKGPVWIRGLRPLKGSKGNAKVHFKAKQAGEYVWRVWVSDGLADSAEQSIRVIVRDTNRAPVADAGSDFTCFAGQEAVLDGRRSRDPDGEPLLYEWRQIDGPPVKLSQAVRPRARFVPRLPGEYGFRLRVADKRIWGDPDTIRVRVLPPNQPPRLTVDLERLAAQADGPVVLRARSSDPEGQPVRYLWQQTTGADLKLPERERQQADLRFTPRANGTYVFRVTASDAHDASPPKFVTVEVTGGSAGSAPVARAPRRVPGQMGHRVTLDGSASHDADGDTIRFRWRQVGGTLVKLRGARSAEASFVPTVRGAYAFSLVVADRRFRSLPRRVTVEVRRTNARPTAAAQQADAPSEDDRPALPPRSN